MYTTFDTAHPVSNIPQKRCKDDYVTAGVVAASKKELKKMIKTETSE